MSSFDQMQTWIFDLDNTLYPASCRLFDQMHVRMGEYVMRRFGVEYAEAKRIQKELYYRHGTTLRGLMVEHGEAPEAFLDHVHDIDYSPVKSHEPLQRALKNLPGRKLVFTNGTTGHAKRVMERLGVSDLFEDIYDIVDADHIPKPARGPYDKFVTQFEVDPRTSAFFEDIARNLEVPHAMGMTTVLVTDDENNDALQLNEGTMGPHVHHQTADLARFLENLTEVRA
jgi:putative hydrolase of the HAD superfamily